jgi:hypothetical protein
MCTKSIPMIVLPPLSYGRTAHLSAIAQDLARHGFFNDEWATGVDILLGTSRTHREWVLQKCVRLPEVGRILREGLHTMRNPTAPVCTSTIAILLAWSSGAFAQASSIELLDVSSPARIRHPASTQSAGPSSHETELRRASRARDSVRERPHQQGHTRAGVKQGGASAGQLWQSDVAEHRQERRGASAGKAGGSGKGNGPT